MNFSFRLMCPTLHWIRFGIDKDGQRYRRSTYWLTIWVIPLTFPIWGLFWIFYDYLVWSFNLSMKSYNELEGSCACRFLLLPFIVIGVLLMTIFMFANFGPFLFIADFFVMFAMPFIIATIPAARDL